MVYTLHFTTLSQVKHFKKVVISEILVIGIHPPLYNSQSGCAFTWRDCHIFAWVGRKATYRVPCSQILSIIIKLSSLKHNFRVHMMELEVTIYIGTNTPIEQMVDVFDSTLTVTLESETGYFIDPRREIRLPLQELM